MQPPITESALRLERPHLRYQSSLVAALASLIMPGNSPTAAAWNLPVVTNPTARWCGGQPACTTWTTARGFVHYLSTRADEQTCLTLGRVPATEWWITEGEQVVGFISLRHRLNQRLLAEGGHIGYSVRPSAQRRGIATWALGQALQRARQVGVERALMTCDEDNLASATVIEANGGTLDNTLHGKRRYWITLA